jgi:hypothetical protein
MLCGDSDTILNVHHNTYENVGNEALGDLVTLCCECHKHYHLLHAKEDQGFHEIKKQYRSILYDFYGAMTTVEEMTANQFALSLSVSIVDFAVDAIVRPTLLDSDV